MKKIVLILLSVLLLVGCAANTQETSATTTPTVEATVATTETTEDETEGNYSDEMKIPYGTDLEEYGADSVEREGDHQDSPYFNTLDFYNMKSSDSLTILENFKTYQQTSEWSCGVAAALMVLDYYGKLGDYNEETLAEFRDNGLNEEATSLKQEMEIFDGVGGFDLFTTFDVQDDLDSITLETIQDSLKDGKPVLICWNDWGGHWQVIIGYDDMGTKDYTGDDVIIVADPYDTTDHNQDGYGVYGAERFYYNWTMYDFFDDEDLNDKLFVIPSIAE